MAIIKVTLKRLFSPRQWDEPFVAALLTLALFILINGLVLFNALKTPANAGYDVRSHTRYAKTLSTGVLPDREDSAEYFSAPLAYVLPALAYANTQSLWVAARTGQLQNVPFSIGITLLIILFARRMSPDRPFHAPMALLTLAILPAYYRTFAFFRGEPMLAFFLLLGLYLLYRSDGTLKNAALVGVCAGLAILSRQWAVLAIPGALIYAVVLARWRWKQIAVAALLIALVAGWFFVSLTIRFGSPTEYVLSLGAQPYPIDFLTGTGKGMLFSRPVRFAYDQQLFPVFYTDLWGDYWGYWAGHTAAYVNAGWLPILSRMNLVNLLPTAVVLYALVRNLRQRQYWLLYLALASTALGYFAYLIHYPTWDSDTIKASYMLQMYPMVALIVGGFLARYWRAALPIGIALLLHNSILLTWHGYPIYLPES